MICILFYQAAYDRVLNAKKAAKLRHRELDSKRRKLKEELEARERQAEESAKHYHSFDRKTDEQKLQVTDDLSSTPASCQDYITDPYMNRGKNYRSRYIFKTAL